MGQKRCQTCGVYLNWKDLWCPCCGNRLRTKPRNRIFKLKFRENQQKYQIQIINENFRNLLNLVGIIKQFYFKPADIILLGNSRTIYCHSMDLIILVCPHIIRSSIMFRL